MGRNHEIGFGASYYAPNQRGAYDETPWYNEYTGAYGYPAVSTPKQLTAAQIALRDKIAATQFAYTTEVPAEFTKPVTRILRGDGIWEVIKNGIGLFTYRVEDKEYLGLPTDLTPSFKMLLPKIPAKILYQTISFYKDVCRKFGTKEAHSYVYYDTKKKQYFAICIPQEVSGASVHARTDDKTSKALDENPRFILALDIHSHNNMGAFFSGTDDNDDVTTRCHMTIGRVNIERPDVVLRAGGYKKWVTIEVTDIFDIESYTNPVPYTAYPPHWLRMTQRYQVPQTQISPPENAKTFSKYSQKHGKFRRKGNHYHATSSGRQTWNRFWEGGKGPVETQRGDQREFNFGDKILREKISPTSREREAWEYLLDASDIAQLLESPGKDTPIDYDALGKVIQDALEMWDDDKLSFFLYTVVCDKEKRVLLQEAIGYWKEDLNPSGEKEPKTSKAEVTDVQS